MKSLFLLIVPIAAFSSAAGQEVGRFAIVTNQVTSLKPGAAEALPAKVGSRIVLEERERTGEVSAAQMLFGEGAAISIGAKTTFSVTREAVEEATGASVSAINLLVGKIRVFVSRFWTDRPEVRVNTPTTVVGIKGSEAVIEVFEDGTTRVTFLAGSGHAKVKRGGAWRDLNGGEQVLVPPDALEVPKPTAISPAVVGELVAQTRARPDPARDAPKGRAGGQYGPGSMAAGSGATDKEAVLTNAPASGGATFANATLVASLPDTPLPSSRQSQIKGGP